MSGAYYVQHGLSRSIAAGSCGCCEGVSVEVPRSIANRPGLSSLAYRIGTHATFFESLLARISTYGVPDPGPQGRLRVPDAPPDRLARLSPGTSLVLPAEARQILPARLLREVLTTRSTTDPAIALLDAWALVADLLTFYQERLANEGFLRTAREQRSLYELSRLIGYSPRPGLSASVYLAFELDDAAALSSGIGASSFTGGPTAASGVGSSAGSEILVPAGTAARSTPKPGQNEEPQTFETSRDLIARPEWNELKPRLTKPHLINGGTVFHLEELHFKGVGKRLSAGDYLAVVYDPSRPVVLHQIAAVDELTQSKENGLGEPITRVRLKQHDLSPVSVLNSIKKIIAEFPTAFPPIDYLQPEDRVEISPNPPAFLRTIHDTLQSFLNAAEKPEIRSSLVELDVLYGQGLVCTQLIESGEIRKWTRDLLGSATALATLLVLPNGLLDLTKARGEYATQLTTTATDFRKGSAFATQLATKIDESTSVGAALQAVKQHLHSLQHWNEPDGVIPSTLASLDTAPIELPLSNECLGSLQIALAGLSESDTIPMATEVTITLIGLAGDTLNVLSDGQFAVENNNTVQLTIKPNSASPAPPLAALLARLRSTKLNGLADGEQGIVRLELKTTLGEQMHTAMTVQHVKRGAANFDIQPASYEGTRFDFESSSDLLMLDSDFAVTSLMPGNSARLSIVVAHSNEDALSFAGTPEYEGVSPARSIEIKPFAATMPDEKSFASALRAVKLAAKTAGTRTVMYELFNSNDATGQPSAVAFRTVLVLARRETNAAAIVDEKGHHVRALASRAAVLHNELGKPGAEHAILAAGFLESVARRATVESVEIQLRRVENSLQPDNQFSAAVGEILKVIADLRMVDGGGQISLGDRIEETAGRLERAAIEADDKLRKLTINAGNELQPPDPPADREIELVRAHARSLVPVLTGTFQENVKQVEEIGTRLSALGGALQQKFWHLDNEVGALAVSISLRLVKLRESFLNEVLSALRDHLSVKNSAVAGKLKDLVEYCRDHLNLLRLAEIVPVQACDDKLRLKALVCRMGREVELACPGETTEGDGLSSLIEAILDENERRSVRGIVQELQALVLRVYPPKPTEEPTSTSRPLLGIEELLGRLRSASDPALRAAALRDLVAIFGKDSGLLLQVARRLSREHQRVLFEALRSIRIESPELEPKVSVFRARANVFGWNAPAMSSLTRDVIYESLRTGVPCLASDPEKKKFLDNIDSLRNEIESQSPPDEDKTRLYLDGSFSLAEQSPIAIFDGGTGRFQVYSIVRAHLRPRNAYGLRGNATVVTVDRPWWTPENPDAFKVIRSTPVLCDAEVLGLAEEPVLDDITAGQTSIELNAMFGELSVGQRLILAGAAIVENLSTGAAQAELLEIAQVKHSVNDRLFGDTYHTTIQLSQPLQYAYRRESVRIYANVVEATHGETQREVLGSGSGAVAFQQFALKRPEVSHVPAPTTSGTESTLAVGVNDVLWDEREGGFLEARPDTEAFVSLTDEQQRMTVVFGDGVNGARPPTGLENIQAVYRAGIGRKGNVDAGQIDQAVGAPLGVKKVINPLRAQGGADPEREESLREHIPLAVTALDRLVSVADYADFARSYAGIGKASAARLSGVVHVTIAGGEPAPLDPEGPIMQNLRTALRRFGDPSQRFEVHNREAALLIVVAKVRIESRRLWEKVEPDIRRALLETFSYEHADLGEDVRQGDVIAAIQAVNGVVYVDLEVFDAVNESEIGFLSQRLGLRRLQKRIHVTAERITSLQEEFAAGGFEGDPRENAKELVKRSNESDELSKPDAVQFRPAQVCYLPADVPDALILEQLR